MHVNNNDVCRFRCIIVILKKDLIHYYAKAPVLSWGLAFPLTLAILLGYYGASMGAWRIVPGLIGVAILFSSTSMAQVAVSFDRMSGGFNLYISAPIPSWTLALSKIFGGTVFGIFGAIMAWIALYLIGNTVPIVHEWYVLAGMFLGSIVFSSLAVLISLRVSPLNAVMVLNGLRFAMVFLGGLLPATIIPSIVHPIAWLLPMCYISDLIRYGSFNIYEWVDPVVALFGAIIFLLGLIIAAIYSAERVLYP